jgi:uncharacterized protein YhhL (DUF1145 family)
MNLLLKSACLALYVLALARLAGWLPDPIFARLPLIAGVVIVAHVAELALMFRHVRRYPGPLATSVALTLLFGLLHWKPLADAHRRATSAP